MKHPLTACTPAAFARAAKTRAFVCGATLLITDILAMILGARLCNVSVVSFSGVYDPVAVAAFIGSALSILRLAGLGHYANRFPMLRELREMFGALILGCAVQVVLLAVRNYTVNIGPALIVWACIALLMPALRIVAKLVMMKLNLWQRDLYIVGGGALALDAATAVAAEPLTGLVLRAFIADNGSRLPRDSRLSTLALRDAAALNGSVVMVALDSTDPANLDDQTHDTLRAEWLRALSLTSASVILVANVPGMPLHGTRTSYVKSHDLLMLQVRNNLSRWHVRVLKRCLDLAGALVISLLLSPVLLFLACKVRKDGGKVFYGHPRVGRGGRSFHCYKFRSMVIDANARLADLLARDANARREWERDFKLKDDPRVTRVGRMMRATSLDELPQLWNVIRGDMSLVGPRPIVTAELERYAHDASYYLMVRPGMTGLWQVSGRNDADYPTRVYLDAWYVRNWSLWYDIAILFMTVRTVLKRDGAY